MTAGTATDVFDIRSYANPPNSLAHLSDAKTESIDRRR